MKYDVGKRKYAEISVSVFATEEIDAGDKGHFEDGICIATPKRSKHQELEEESPKNKSLFALKTSKFLSSITDQALSVLSTPTIEKKRPQLFYSEGDINKTKDSQCIAETSSCLPTPKHSILKISRRPMNDCQLSNEKSSFQNVHSFTNLPDSQDCQLQNDDIEDYELLTKLRRNPSTPNMHNRSRESTPGKSLRFNVPKRLPPASAELNDEMKLEGIENYDLVNEDCPNVDAVSDKTNDSQIHDVSVPIDEIKEPISSECNFDPKKISEIDKVYPDEQYNEIRLIEAQSGPNLLLEQRQLEANDGSEKIELFQSPNTSSSLKYQKIEHDKQEILTEEQIDLDLSNDEEYNKNVSDQELHEDSKTAYSTKTSELVDISVFQAGGNETHVDPMVSEKITNIARKSLSCFNDQAHENMRSEEVNSEYTRCEEKLENIIDMSVYETTEVKRDETLNNTMIRQLARDITSSPVKEVDNSDTLDNLSQTVVIPEMSVCIPIETKEENNLNQTLIRKMAEEAICGPSDISDTDEKKSLKASEYNSTDISVYEKSNNDNEIPANATMIQTLVETAQNENATIALLDEIPDNRNASRCPIDLSIYVDNDKRISPDPEVTLNFPSVQTLENSKSAADTALILTSSSNKAESLPNSVTSSNLPCSSSQNLNISVFDNTEVNPSTNNMDFIKSLAKNKFRSFEFSSPSEATPAAAAKHRHRSKSDRSKDSNSPVFKFSNPISSIDTQIAKNSSHRFKETDSTTIELDIDCRMRDENMTLSQDVDDEKTVSVIDASNKNINESHEDKEDVTSLEANDVSKEKRTTKFSFSTPLDSRGVNDEGRKDGSLSGNADQPRFNFSEAESLLESQISSNVDLLPKDDDTKPVATIKSSSEPNTDLGNIMETTHDFTSSQNSTNKNSSGNRSFAREPEIEHPIKGPAIKDDSVKQGKNTNSSSKHHFFAVKYTFKRLNSSSIFIFKTLQI